MRGKALTTYDDFGKGVLEAVGVVAEVVGVPSAEFLAATTEFTVSTTVVTNSLMTLRGARVGVLVTSGFKDTFRIGDSHRSAVRDDHLQENAPDMVDRRWIVEIDERTDGDGSVLLAPDPSVIVAAARRLVDEFGVVSVAICFVNSYLNPDNELRAAQAVRDAGIGTFVVQSHQMSPVIGENRRWTTAVLSAFVQSEATRFVASLRDRLDEGGFTGNLSFFQGLGGRMSSEAASEQPLALYGSGPAGGAVGAKALAERMQTPHVLLGDMGGTSFDTGIITDYEPHIAGDVQVGPLRTTVNIVDIDSVGAGGGSIAWISERGVPRVGPQSARSEPGPAAYGRGGTEPTVTDAMIVLGVMDPENYLGGRLKLRPDLAENALDRVIATPLGSDIENSAAAVHDLVVAHMASAMREVTVAKGYDPRAFAFVAYGGTLPMFAAEIARRLTIERVIIPHNSSVFCAVGVLSSDYMVRLTRTIGDELDSIDEDAMGAIAEEMLGQARELLQAQGFSADDIALEYSGEFRFTGQHHELPMALDTATISASDAPQLSEQFFRLYERTYGAGTAWKDSTVRLVNYVVTARASRDKAQLTPAALSATAPNKIQTGSRAVFLPSKRSRENIPLYADDKFTPGSSVNGPAIIDASDTTIFVPPGFRASRDEFLNYVLTDTEVTTTTEEIS
ncbi:hydantoinase/oxoprolinase family protein [Microcella sp.]|uniref:hydantoinase/oxoprolinase family protein n=1 Tax=Microcella sp. TaxID=1913979 RepID=UPI00345C08A9